MVQKGEVILIDMDTLATGNPVFEFASIYLGFRDFSELDHKAVEKFLSLTWDQAKYFNCTGEALESIKTRPVCQALSVF
ncbi:MAG: hypothetical protein K6F82_02290 [Sphaerochaetaceae bacterium]|nr:hypothetical protein [Sphaerochaetaceae bacterium]